MQILSVCITCRRAEDDPDAPRPGADLCRRISGVVDRDATLSGYVRPVRCMSQCKRPCVVAFSGAGRLTYLFGDLLPDRDAPAVVEAFTLYRRKPLGYLLRAERPPALRAGILGRVPPPDWWPDDGSMP
ncbi:MAG: DUF1636 domain-containing protein [Geminicoccaceae bacterium]